MLHPWPYCFLAPFYWVAVLLSLPRPERATQVRPQNKSRSPFKLNLTKCLCFCKLEKQQSNVINVALPTNTSGGNYQQKAKTNFKFQISKYVLPTSVTMGHQYIIADMLGYCLSFGPTKVMGKQDYHDEAYYIYKCAQHWE